MAVPTGTIVWFKISEGALPPISTNMEPNQSDLLLLTDGKWIDFGFYWHLFDQWKHEGKWEPTHWAYINFPS